jgi:hypothetical protein
MHGLSAQVFSQIGILGSCLLLLANLGSRAWYNLQWQPLQYDGIGASLVAYVYSVLTGLCVPFLAHRKVRTGGRAALEHVLTTSLIVAVFSVISSANQVQSMLLGMSHVSAHKFKHDE